MPSPSLFFAFALALVPAQTTTPRWIVLPIHCTEPPPADPTLLRLTKTIGEAIHEAVGEEVRVASREVRDERCPSEDGSCPRDIAELIDTERVVALVLSPKYDALAVRVFRGTRGVETEGKLACRWAEGGVACDTAPLAKLLAAEQSSPPVDMIAVKDAFDAMRPSFARCRAEDPTATAEAWVSFRARPDGRVIDVRIEPKELQESRAHACMARMVESLHVPAFEGTKPESFRFSLGEEGSQKATARAAKAAKAAKAKPKAKRKPKPNASGAK